MTETFFGRQTLSFYFGPHPICWLRGKGFSISTAARHQGMIKMFWHHYPAAKLSIIWTANIPPLLSSAGSPGGGACPTSDLSAEATGTLAHFWCISTHDGGLKPIWPIFWRFFTLFVYIVTDPICDTEEEYIGIGSLELWRLNPAFVATLLHRNFSRTWVLIFNLASKQERMWRKMKFKALVNNLVAKNPTLEAAAMIFRCKERWMIGQTDKYLVHTSGVFYFGQLGIISWFIQNINFRSLVIRI